MKRKFSYSMKEMNYRLLMMGRPIWKYIGISTLASTLGALSHMGLMGFGALWLLAAAGFCDGAGIYAALTAVCAVLIAVCRYLEGVFSHLGAYGILAKMRVHLFNAIDRIAPAYLIGRETGDVMNIAVSDIETLEYFFAHTIGPMFTVILLPTTTVVIAWCVNPLYALVLIPIYLIISVVLPLVALKAGRGIGMRYRERLGDLKSKILESVYSIRDIQIFGAGHRRMQVVEQANSKVNQAALGLTELFRVPGKNPDSGVRRRAGIPRYQSSGGNHCPVLCGNGFSVFHLQPDLCGDEPAGELCGGRTYL